MVKPPPVLSIILGRNRINFAFGPNQMTWLSFCRKYTILILDFLMHAILKIVCTSDIFTTKFITVKK